MWVSSPANLVNLMIGSPVVHPPARRAPDDAIRNQKEQQLSTTKRSYNTYNQPANALEIRQLAAVGIIVTYAQSKTH